MPVEQLDLGAKLAPNTYFLQVRHQLKINLWRISNLITIISKQNKLIEIAHGKQKQRKVKRIKVCCGKWRNWRDYLQVFFVKTFRRENRKYEAKNQYAKSSFLANFTARFKRVRISASAGCLRVNCCSLVVAHYLENYHLALNYFVLSICL